MLQEKKPLKVLVEKMELVFVKVLSYNCVLHV